MGKPRQGPEFDLMKKSRLSFKQALKRCQQMEDVARADAMAKSMQAKDVKGFWKNISKTYNKAVYRWPLL